MTLSAEELGAALKLIRLPLGYQIRFITPKNVWEARKKWDTPWYEECPTEPFLNGGQGMALIRDIIDPNIGKPSHLILFFTQVMDEGTGEKTELFDTVEQLLDWLGGALLRAEHHEVFEWFAFNGKLWIDPHEPNWNDPYLKRLT